MTEHTDAVGESRPVLLDLFCKAGGCTKGYQRAGFYVVGVDKDPQPNYCGDEFHQADANEVLDTWDLSRFAAIGASPPCQYWTTANARYRGQGGLADSHEDLLTPTRARLVKLGIPYVIENVEGAARGFAPTLRLTGPMFGLPVWRPRLFECSFLMLAPRGGKPSGLVIGVYGDRPDGRYLNSRTKHTTGNRAASSIEEARTAMGIDWMDWSEITQAIPPAYTEWIGRHLIDHLAQVAGGA